ncbi:MAG: hypothetical protein LC772_10425, partial [Chloroflexi bacterium]|nr:hypothetical protein [Chloroflexota bacterium]
AVPASVREGLPSPHPDGSETEGRDTGDTDAGGSAGMALVLAPLLYPMMPISFIRPQGYQQPSAAFWEETFALEA